MSILPGTAGQAISFYAVLFQASQESQAGDIFPYCAVESSHSADNIDILRSKFSPHGPQCHLCLTWQLWLRVHAELSFQNSSFQMGQTASSQWCWSYPEEANLEGLVFSGPSPLAAQLPFSQFSHTPPPPSFDLKQCVLSRVIRLSYY